MYNISNCTPDQVQRRKNGILLLFVLFWLFNIPKPYVYIHIFVLGPYKTVDAIYSVHSILFNRIFHRSVCVQHSADGVHTGRLVCQRRLKQKARHFSSYVHYYYYNVAVDHSYLPIVIWVLCFALFPRCIFVCCCLFSSCRFILLCRFTLHSISTHYRWIVSYKLF